PSRTNAIWAPSGENAACVWCPGKLVSGVVWKGGDGFTRRANAATPTPTPATPASTGTTTHHRARVECTIVAAARLQYLHIRDETIPALRDSLDVAVVLGITQGLAE